jgi:hypothetical protein
MPLLNPYANGGTYRFVPNKQMYIEAQQNKETSTKIIEHENRKMTDEENYWLQKSIEKRDADLKEQRILGRPRL